MEQKIKVLIVEDEWITSEEIKTVLERNEIEVVGQEDRGEYALDIIKEEEVDVAILDINIKGEIDGIELAKKINEIRSTAIIFLTAYDDKKFIDRAKEVVPAAYMVKPFQPKNLLISIEMAFSQLEVDNDSAEQDHAVEFVVNDRIFIKENNLLVKILLGNITHVEAVGSYSKIYTNKNTHTLSMNLKSFEKKLDHEDFIRVHRSYLVNLTKIDAINGNLIYMEENTIPIGSSHRAAVLERFKVI